MEGHHLNEVRDDPQSRQEVVISKAKLERGRDLSSAGEHEQENDQKVTGRSASHTIGELSDRFADVFGALVLNLRTLLDAINHKRANGDVEYGNDRQHCYVNVGRSIEEVERFQGSKTQVGWECKSPRHDCLHGQQYNAYDNKGNSEAIKERCNHDLI